ncbi:MAG: VRR-NUC domain-containing protein [Gammaproteobacteria bacterium]|nr:VRR-NUC domain-containing protein [Gammaproteobacteria bacterium]
MSSEKLIEKKLGLKIKNLGGWSIKLLSLHISGLPDRICLLPGGRLFFAEVKTTGEKPTPIQRLVHKKIRALGFRVEVIDNMDKLNEIIKDYGRITGKSDI